jgi:predicted nucleic acid-binding protein
VSTAFVDTDVIIRFLTGDDPVKQAAARRLFGRAGMEDPRLVVPHTVVADAVYVLRSPRLYRYQKSEIAEMLIDLLSQPGFDLADRQAMLDALDLYGEFNKLDFSDALIIAMIWSDGPSLLYSYDTDYDTFPEINRREPD